MKNLFLDLLRQSRGISVDSKYYADSYLHNIYPKEMSDNHIRMFCKGGGKELLPKDGEKEKAACIYSSSMLSYNFFHWIGEETSLTYDGVVYDTVVFEEQFRVLKNRNNKANLDVVLVSNDRNTILLLESKFTEHLQHSDSAPDIRDAYEQQDSYFADGKEWVRVINELKRISSNGEKQYYEGLKQIVCHLIGISAAVLSEQARFWFNSNSWLHHIEDFKLTGKEKMIFKSIVFHPFTEIEGKASSDYEQLNREFISKIDFLPQNVVVEPYPIITYKQLWDQGLCASIKDDALREYLSRYMAIHA